MNCTAVFEDEEASREIDGIPTIDATGHTEVTDTSVEPTCETDGKTAGSHCSVCNTVITEQTIIPKLNHNWSEWEITAEPTQTDEVIKTRECKNGCGTKEAEKIPVLKFSIKYENEKAVVTVPEDSTYTVIFAAYDDSGKLLSVSAKDVPFVKGENEPIEPQNFNASGKVKVTLWDSLKGMKPLCAADGN